MTVAHEFYHQGGPHACCNPFTETGGPYVLHATEVDAVAPGPNEVIIEHDAIGVNYLDITQRNGAVKIPLPSGFGLEAAESGACSMKIGLPSLAGVSRRRTE